MTRSSPSLQSLQQKIVALEAVAEKERQTGRTVPQTLRDEILTARRALGLALRGGRR